MSIANELTGVRSFATITCTVGREILDGAIVSRLDLDEPAWTVRVFVELIMQPALLSFRCLVSGKAVGTTTASYRELQESDQTLAASEGSTSHSTATSYYEVDGASQKSSRDDDPSTSASPASDTSVENGMAHRFTRDWTTQNANRKISTGARHGRMIHLGVNSSMPRTTSMDSRTGLLSPPYPVQHRSSRSTECLASSTWV